LFPLADRLSYNLKTLGRNSKAQEEILNFTTKSVPLYTNCRVIIKAFLSYHFQVILLGLYGLSIIECLVNQNLLSNRCWQIVAWIGKRRRRAKSRQMNPG
jgi:hypothetical protein